MEVPSAPVGGRGSEFRWSRTLPGREASRSPTRTPRAGAFPGLPIAEVSRQLGVPMPTLRSWELRYGIPPTVRSFGKHRRYSPSELHTLRLMRDEIARGRRASLAADAVRELLEITGPAAEHIAAILDASERSDPVAVRAHLSEAHAALGLGPCLDDVLLPAMQQVGLWWQTGRCTVEDEHLTTEAARGMAGDPQLLRAGACSYVVPSCLPADRPTCTPSASRRCASCCDTKAGAADSSARGPRCPPWPRPCTPPGPTPS